ncbi:hypothetical protein HanRHA438_Chr13g0614841 [Helianthus annuus]|nr:hypothetical protein HanRHA438_Chr13g0614841 [Helianthus annuus]
MNSFLFSQETKQIERERLDVSHHRKLPQTTANYILHLTARVLQRCHKPPRTTSSTLQLGFYKDADIQDILSSIARDLNAFAG